MRSRFSAQGLAALFLACLVAGCSLFQRSQPPLCPQVLAVPEGDHVTRFRPGGRDLTDVLFEARLLDARGSCRHREEEGVIEAELVPVFSLTRGPADREGRIRFRYFVAITEATGTAEQPPRILARQEFELEAEFTGNVNRLAVRDELVPSIPLSPGKNGADYRIYIGLVMTPEEFRHNRQAS